MVEKKKKKSLELVPKEAPLDDLEGEIEVVVERPRKNKKPRKNVLPPSTEEVSTSMREMEEDPKEMIPLSRRTRTARELVGEQTMSQDTSLPMT